MQDALTGVFIGANAGPTWRWPRNRRDPIELFKKSLLTPGRRGGLGASRGSSYTFSHLVLRRIC